MPLFVHHGRRGLRELAGVAPRQDDHTIIFGDDPITGVDGLARNPDRLVDLAVTLRGAGVRTDKLRPYRESQLQDPAVGDTDRRLLWRVSVTGKPPILR